MDDAAAIARYVAQRRCSASDAVSVASSPRARRRRGAHLVADTPRHERAQLLATRAAAELAADMRAAGKCASCALHAAHCICRRLEQLRAKSARVGPGLDVKFVVWMHVHERGRSSNTGKLLELVVPGAEVLLQDVPEHSSRFKALVGASRGRACVLFPSDTAVPVAELAGALPAESDGAAARRLGEGSAVEAAAPLLVVVVDGTWRQAKRMHREFEGIRHVALEPCGQSEFHWRRQSQEGRVSTVEAAALFLEALGEDPVVGRPALLREALSELNAALERQCHYDAFLAGPPPPEPSARKKAAASQRLPKRSPGLRSQASDTDGSPASRW